VRLNVAPRLSVVYPTLGNVFYQKLAKRLFEAASELGVEVRLIGSSALDSVERSWMESVAAFVVSPNECFLSGVDAMKSLNHAPFRAAVLAECVGTQWYRDTFTLDVDFDLVVDVGFLDQEAARSFQMVPYKLLYNAPLPKEAEQIRCANEDQRPLSWALIGHVTPDRLLLAEELLSRFGSRAFLFLPQLRPVRPAEGMLGPAAIDAVLRATNIYVWCSHHTLPYYESFRFLDAMMCGALPCKIDAGSWSELRTFPNVYETVDDLAGALRERSVKDLFDDSLEFALGQGLLTDRLAELLQDSLDVAL
jgi:hypothetical protein